MSGRLKPQRWEQPENATCGGKPLDASPLRTIVLGEGQTLANVYVAIKSGFGDREFATPRSAVLLDQVGCAYRPRVIGLMTHQVLIVRNSDDTMHNIHVELGYAAAFNPVQHGKGDERTLRFSKPEIGKIVRCDVHPWMTGWIHVSDHPFFAVTAIDGAYSIPGLPPGEYEILAWHERFKDAPLISKVKVEAGKASTLDFTFEAPSK